MRLEGQHNELIHQLAGHAESLGWEGRDLKAMDNREVVIQGKHEDQATHLHQRVTRDAHSTVQLPLIINHHVIAEEAVIRDASEMTRLLFQEQQ